LSGVAALSLIGVAAAQAEIIYAADVDPGYPVDRGYAAGDDVIATTPGRVYAVPAPPFGIFTPQYIVTQPTVVVAPPAPAVAPATRVIERDRVVVAPRPRGIAPRERVIERERVVLEPPRAPAVRDRVVVAPRPEIVTTGSSTSSSCFIDLNGFERCY
jgi:hypothetical protein